MTPRLTTQTCLSSLPPQGRAPCRQINVQQQRQASPHARLRQELRHGWRRKRVLQGSPCMLRRRSSPPARWLSRRSTPMGMPPRSMRLSGRAGRSGRRTVCPSAPSMRTRWIRLHHKGSCALHRDAAQQMPSTSEPLPVHRTIGVPCDVRLSARSIWRGCGSQAASLRIPFT